MATPGRTIDPDLEFTSIRKLLETEPQNFQFFQAVRLLEKLLPERERVGAFVPPDREVVRFRAHPSMVFPASEIQSLEKTGELNNMTVNFMGLVGPLGMLPLYYTDMVMERSRLKDTAMRDFFDMFHHRIISLFYRAWEKYRFTTAYEQGDPDRLSSILLDLVGLGTQGLAGRQKIPDNVLLHYSGLLSQHPRSAIALEQIIADYFEVPVTIEQFAGKWHKLDKKDQSRIADANSIGEMLDFGVVLGDEIWNQQSGVRVRIGPLPLDQYLDLLPTGKRYPELKALVAYYFNHELDFELQLVLKREDTPACDLGKEAQQQAPRLGWTSWIKTAPLNRDPDEAIIPL
ncbi:MAG TPA: type VI secretion system baseplate subunit TssG [Candidatus Koribacter sp.]|jgi:type VI secretion system protein ImpH